MSEHLTDTTQRGRVSVLMYHEISREKLEGGAAHHLTPAYDIPATLFDEHMSLLARSGFRTPLLQDTTGLDSAAKQVIITFDDGLAGNFAHALPILQQHGFRAVFFVAVGAVGKPHYMSWDQLRELCRNGMEVQSHTVSHRPLQTLSQHEVRQELLNSKTRLEQELRKPVTALSFPHGSYNDLVVQIAREVGYRTLCTSEVKRNPVAAFMSEPVILGRIAVTSKFSSQRVRRCAEGNVWEIRRQLAVKQAKNMVKRVVGIENYRRMYRKYFNISET